MFGGPDLDMDHCTFWGNQASDGSALWLDDLPGTPEVSHTIFSGNLGAPVSCATVSIECCDILMIRDDRVLGLDCGGCLAGEQWCKQ